MSYIDNKVHHSHGNVPFSWENKPGERKAAAAAAATTAVVAKEDMLYEREDDVGIIKLPPPPYDHHNTLRAYENNFHDLQIPLPPCAYVVQTPKRSSSRRGIRNEDDPFLIAYKECTKTSSRGKGKGKGESGSLIRKNVSFMSCKHSCSVRDDSIVRISHLPISKSQRDCI